MRKIRSKKKEKELTINGKSLWDWSKENGWIPCKNGCCSFDPSVKDRTCMADVKPKGILPTSKKVIYET